MIFYDISSFFLYFLIIHGNSDWGVTVREFMKASSIFKIFNFIYFFDQLDKLYKIDKSDKPEKLVIFDKHYEVQNSTFCYRLNKFDVNSRETYNGSIFKL